MPTYYHTGSSSSPLYIGPAADNGLNYTTYIDPSSYPSSYNYTTVIPSPNNSELEYFQDPVADAIKYLTNDEFFDFFYKVRDRGPTEEIMKGLFQVAIDFFQPTENFVLEHISLTDESALLSSRLAPKILSKEWPSLSLFLQAQK